MLKNGFLGMLLLLVSGLWAQESETPYKKKKITVSTDTILLEKVSINKEFFNVLDGKGNLVDTAFYKVNFQKGTLVFKNN